MSNLISGDQRAKITEAMKALGSLCPNRFGALNCSEKCIYKARYVCPAELSIYIQHFLESTECMSAEELVEEDKYDIGGE